MRHLFYILLFLPPTAYSLFEPVDTEANILTTPAIYVSPAFIHTNLGISTEYIIPFGLSELATQRFAVRLPTNIGSFALRISNFGEQKYRENELSIGYGNVFKTIRFGTFIKLLYISTSEFGSNYVISGDVGVMSTFNTCMVWLGFTNLTNPHIETDAIGSILSGGILISPEDWFDIDIRISKQEGFETSTKVIGLTSLSSFLTVRFGMNTSPRSFIAGATIYIKNIDFTYTTTTHQDLGLSHIVSLCFTRK